MPYNATQRNMSMQLMIIVSRASFPQTFRNKNNSKTVKLKIAK